MKTKNFLQQIVENIKTIFYNRVITQFKKLIPKQHNKKNKMKEILRMFSGKNYSKITPLIHLNIMSIFVFGPCLTYLLSVNNDKWWVFLAVLLLPFLYTLYKYEYYSWKRPEHLESESFQLSKVKYDIISSKTENGGITLNTNLNFNDNDEI